MVTKIISKHIVYPDGIRAGEIYIEDGVIVDKTIADEVIDATNYFVSPGLIDIHTHGALGVDFSESSEEEIISILKFYALHGVTSLLPTITSSTKENILKALEQIKLAMQDKEFGSMIIGAHLEGPYFSKKQCGAQDPNLITEPIEKDYKEIVNKYAEVIRRWDYAPENDKGGKFAKYLNKHNIIASAGHSDATMDDMVIAKNNGMNLITHFYSCTSTITRDHGYRKLGIVECGYSWDDLYIEIIADGMHLPISLLQMILKLKDNNKIILVSDSLKVTGLKDKYSTVGTTKCVVDDGVCKLLDKSAFAGSIATGDKLINVMLATGVTLDKAIMMGSTNPAILLNEKKGQICTGFEANIVISDKNFKIKRVFIKGKEIC